jgi:hypothetical protein
MDIKPPQSTGDPMNTQERLDDLCAFYESLTHDDVALFSDFYAHDAQFKDPFHEVGHLEDIQTIFKHMFVVAPDAKFHITHRFSHEQTAMMIWQMTMTVAKRQLAINGTTYFEWNDHGLVRVHRDYWDASEEMFAKLPFIGAPTRWLLRQFSAFKQ